MFSTINRYILRTWFKPFVGMFLFVSAIFFIQKVTIWLPKLLEHEAPLELAVSLFLAMLPIELTLLIPIVYFFALIKLVRELQTNSEIDAMYAGGRSITNIFVPVFWVGVLLTVVMFWLTMNLAPAGKVEAYNAASKLASLKVEPTFQPKKFVIGIDNIVFYFEGHNPDGSYARIMLSDTRNKSEQASVYFAERATISRIETGLMVSLFEGSQLSGEKDKLRSTNFSHYNIEVPLKLGSTWYHKQSSDKSPTHMDGITLFNTLSEEDVPLKNIANWHYRLVSSLSVLLLFLFAVPLSLQAKRSKQSGVYLIATAIMVSINQIELLLLKKVEFGLLPWWSFWLTFILFIFIAGWMYYNVNQHGSISIPRKLNKKKV